MVIIYIYIYIYVYNKKHIFKRDKYFACTSKPSAVCVDKALYGKFTYTTPIKN